MGLAPAQHPVQVLQAGPHEEVAVGGTGDHPVAKRNADRVHAQRADLRDVRLADEALPVRPDFLRGALVAQPEAQRLQQGPLAAALRPQALEKGGAGARLQQQPPAQVDAAPRGPPPIQAPVLVQEAVQAGGGAVEVNVSVLPVSQRRHSHRAHPRRSLGRGQRASSVPAQRRLQRGAGLLPDLLLSCLRFSSPRPSHASPAARLTEQAQGPHACLFELRGRW
mmetsp:Transcript_99032/g.266087  ORF Transcript_99032/g.266087 Transcript_99032/m.266087 type:complete len:223 (+) Transcript_99032:859-1527(+)